MERDAWIKTLRGTVLLGTLPDPDLLQLLAACSERPLHAGETLCHEGAPGDSMYVVLAGHILVSRGGKQVAVSKPGDCIGEMALIESRERVATLRAQDQAVVLEIPETAFRRHIAPNPAALLALLRIFSDRSRRDLETLAAHNLKLQNYAAEVERSNQMLTAIRHELEEKNRLLERLSALDTLTGIANRRRFDAVLRHEWRRASRDETPLSLVFCDIDFFKPYNDTYGHPAGDRCLARVAQTMEDTLNRPADLAARYGGEEFVALLVDTGQEGARLLAERIRERVESLQLEHRTSSIAPHLTVSLGVASALPRQAGRPDELVNRSDRALYRAKRAGRNRVAVWPDEAERAVPPASDAAPR